jgi:hypothetical protein
MTQDTLGRIINQISTARAEMKAVEVHARDLADEARVTQAHLKAIQAELVQRFMAHGGLDQADDPEVKPDHRDA